MEETLFIKLEKHDEVNNTILLIKTKIADVKKKLYDFDKIDDIEKRKISECQELIQRIEEFTDKTDELLNLK